MINKLLLYCYIIPYINGSGYELIAVAVVVGCPPRHRGRLRRWVAQPVYVYGVILRLPLVIATIPLAENDDYRLPPTCRC